MSTPLKIAPWIAGVTFAAFLIATALADTSASHMTQLYGTAWSPALGAWLPKIGKGFDPWNRGQASLSGHEDYYACGSDPTNPAPESTLYAGARCTLLQSGTYFVYGYAGPPKGRVVYDSAHKIALYEEGCCGWGNVLIASGVGALKSRASDRGNTCGQFQNFAFREGHLAYIVLSGMLGVDAGE